MLRTALLSTLVLTACSDVVVDSDVSYDDRYDATKLDVYSPGPATTPRGAVVVIHGGGWHAGIDRTSMAQYADRLAQAGYVAFNIEYRLTPDGGEFPHAVQDCLCALSYVRAHAADYRVDPARIASLGYSAGGHLASMLGVAAGDPGVAPDCAMGASGPVAAVVSGAGPEDMTLFPEVSVITDFMGGTQAQVPDVYAEASPLTHVAAGAPPYLFVHGDNDWFVSIEHTYRMRDALDAVGTSTHLLELPGDGHLWNRGADGATWELEPSIDTPESWAAVIDFLDKEIGQ